MARIRFVRTMQSNIYMNILKCYYFNERSIINKLPNLDSLLISSIHDFILITETWLSPYTHDAMLINGAPYQVIVKIDITLYTDDSKLYITQFLNTDLSAQSQALQIFSTWSNIWQLILHTCILNVIQCTMEMLLFLLNIIY